jgi:GTP cyclohydrolase II
MPAPVSSSPVLVPTPGGGNTGRKPHVNRKTRNVRRRGRAKLESDSDTPLSLLKIQCMARTRIPTPYGPAFLHLYHNNRDSKEHLAIVVDSAQLSESESTLAPSIRSRSLDAVWSDNETEMERITRGAYVGRLTSTSQITSQPSSRKNEVVMNGLPPPLVRIHSECFTGETVGSMRCDCGEQLDEAMRLMFQPVTIASPTPVTIPGRGAIVYLRQEGRGIGLLSKIHAYNLQDIGHDTVTANIMLGHKADERKYDIACAILRDLGLGTETGEGVQLLTNNPEKVRTLEIEGLRVVKRVPMIPRSWQNRAPPTPGTTLMGGMMVHGTELDKYLRTKVVRMGHRLPLMETIQ